MIDIYTVSIKEASTRLKINTPTVKTTSMKTNEYPSPLQLAEPAPRNAKRKASIIGEMGFIFINQRQFTGIVEAG